MLSAKNPEIINLICIDYNDDVEMALKGTRNTSLHITENFCAEE